jgi:hypothetical protein
MLFSPVYTESHPRRDAGLAACCTSSIFSNPFRSYSFRTLASHLKATVSSNSFEIKPFRTLCKIPGIGYPPPFLFNLSSTLRLRRRPTERYVSPLFSHLCGRFPLQRTGTPPPHKKSPACPQRSRGVPSFQRFTHISRPSLPRASRGDSTWWEPLFSLHGSRVTHHQSRILFVCHSYKLCLP